jgi:ligand-binding sensor domain-containing protein/serine phosphatase RsbU (regulator of sigma subunit)
MRIKIAILLATLGMLVSAQTTSFISYGMEQGLVQNQVQSITQDNEGNLWVGTIAGLSKYNGTTWQNFTKNTNLAEDWITCSYKDRDGNIWFGHWAGGVTRYSIAAQRLENLNLEEYTRFKSIRAMVQDATGKLWIATEGAGVFIFDPVSEKMYAVSSHDGLSSSTVYDICTDDKQNMWMATDSGLTVFNLNSSISQRSSFKRISTQNGLFSKNITAVKVTSSQLLVIGSADQGVAIVPLAQGIADWEAYISRNQVVLGESQGLKSTFIKTVYEDHKKNLWIGTIGGGVSLFITDKNLMTADAIRNGFFKTYSTRQGLNYFNVNSIYEDREYNLWIGTDLGLNMYRGDFMQTFDEADDLPNNIVWCTYADSENNLWVGTNNGLAKLSFSYQRFGRIENHDITRFDEKNGLPSNVVLSAFEDSKGNMWFGTAFAGVCMLPKGSSSFTTYSVKDGLASEMVYSIAEDKNGNMWFGTKSGATRFNPAAGEFRNFTESDGLGGNHIYRIFKDSKGLLWLGALGGNLCMYDGNSFKKFDEGDGLKHKFILCINEDKAGHIWFGCYGGGLFMYDGKYFTNYTTRNGLKTESPFSILVDNSNNIWIGDNRGIDKFDTKTNRFYHYGKAEGFMGVECNPNAACIDRQGCLWFGTIMGAVRFNPTEELANTFAPLTKIYGLKIHLKDTVFPADGVFAYNENNLTFKFIGVSLTNSEKIKYEYTLDGFDRGWVPARAVQEATYTNLPPGDYVFKVRAYNNNGVVSDAVSYAFKVKPPFWQTALFYVLMAVIIIFGIFVFDKVRTRNLKILNAQLEAKVEERTVQLAIKNEELAEKNKNITDSIRYAKRIQDGMLPREEHFKKLLPEYFILFKPKDIVSGDFYWIRKHQDAIFIAAVDCTGHGVPGAFLSIVANDLLNEAFEMASVKSPALILNELTKLACKALHARVDDMELRDGMDLALCKIDTVSNKAEYAGAYNSLYLIRQNKLIEYNPDNISIGSEDHQDKLYTNHSFNLEKGDIIYLFSDGYADQFGGEKGKKFKYHQMQQLLVKNNNKSLDLQKHLLEQEFETWKGGLEQVDDVLVLGIRI